MGRVRAVCISEKKGTEKIPVEQAEFLVNHGIKGDSHAGIWHRQVSLLSFDKVEEFNEKGGQVKDGDFGENLLVEGMDFRTMPVGTQIFCGDVVLEITQIGKECHSHCAIRRRVGDCIMPREGVFARVLNGGTIRPGDEMEAAYPKPDRKLRAAVITMSDSGYRGEREDVSGPLCCRMLEQAGYTVEEAVILPDEKELLKHKLIYYADSRQVDLVLTTGGTGFSLRDCTPEATMEAGDRNAPGIAEAMRYASLKVTKRAMLGRGVSVLRKRTLIVNLPGSPKAVEESLGFILDELDHGIRILNGLTGECAQKKR